MAWGQFTQKKSCHLLCTAKYRRLGSDLLHGPNRFGRFAANKIKNSCCSYKVMQRHGFSVFALILVSVYISNPKWCWLISIVETCHGEYFQAVSFCSSFLTRKKKIKYLSWIIEESKCRWEGKFYCRSSITLLNNDII